MGWGGGWRAITFLGTCTHVMCYVMGFWVVRLMLTCAWGGTSREMFNVPGCPDAEKKGDQAMRCSLWLTSQFEQRSICVFSSYNIYIYVFIFIYLFIYLYIITATSPPSMKRNLLHYVLFLYHQYFDDLQQKLQKDCWRAFTTWPTVFGYLVVYIFFWGVGLVSLFLRLI